MTGTLFFIDCKVLIEAIQKDRYEDLPSWRVIEAGALTARKYKENPTYLQIKNITRKTHLKIQTMLNQRYYRKEEGQSSSG